MYRERLKSHEQLRQLTEMLKWANSPTDNGISSHFADCAGFYGYIQLAITEILMREGGIDFESLEVDWGGNESWYEDLMIAVDNATHTYQPDKVTEKLVERKKERWLGRYPFMG